MRFSLRTKWTLALLLTSGLPLLLCAYVLIRIQALGLEVAEQEREVAMIDHIAQLVRGSLGEAADDTHRVGLLLTDSRIPDPDARIALATDVINGCEALAGVAVYRSDGSLLDALYRTDGKLGARRPIPPEHLSAAVIGGESGTWHRVTTAGDSAIMHYIEPIEQQRQWRAFALGMVTAQSLGDRTQRLAQDHCGGRGDCVLVLDAEQRIIAGGAEKGPLSVGQSLKGKDVLGRAELSPEILTQQIGFTWQFQGLQGERMIGSVRTLPEYGWILAVRRPWALAFGVMRAVRLLVVISTLMLLALAVLYGRYIAKRTTRPIHKLVLLTRSYAQRRFGERSVIATGDELEELGNSLTDMAMQLAVSEKEIERRARIESGLSRFLPEEVARSIASGQQPLALGGQRRNISVLFADVVAFTSFAESAPPERVVALLNELFTVLAEVVFRHGGIIDKFIGDSMMAIFGAPSDQPDHARRALTTAEAIHRFVEANSPAWRVSYGIEVQMAIGINSGEALVGNLGSEKRMEYTAIGDVVNVAARLEGVAQPGQTLVTADVAAAAGDEFSFHSLGEHPLRGKRNAVQILEVV